MFLAQIQDEDGQRLGPMTARGVYPVTHLDQWCGEYARFVPPPSPIPIESLRLGKRSLKALRGARIYTVSDLEKATETDLFRLKNIGAWSHREIVMALARKGLQLSTEY